jgi:hypothetical protein
MQAGASAPHGDASRKVTRLRRQPSQPPVERARNCNGFDVGELIGLDVTGLVAKLIQHGVNEEGIAAGLRMARRSNTLAGVRSEPFLDEAPGSGNRQRRQCERRGLRRHREQELPVGGHARLVERNTQHHREIVNRSRHVLQPAQ